MKVVFSRRFEKELDQVFREGVAKFGLKTASETFVRIDRALSITLAAQPHLGQRIAARNLHRYVVVGSPFVIYYRVAPGILTAVALRHGAQDRSEFERR